MVLKKIEWKKRRKRTPSTCKDLLENVLTFFSPDAGDFWKVGGGTR